MGVTKNVQNREVIEKIRINNANILFILNHLGSTLTFIVADFVGIGEAAPGILTIG